MGKKRPQQIQEAEFAMVQKAIRALECDCRAEIKDKAIVLHTADQSSLDTLTNLLGPTMGKNAYADSALYMAMLRFVLADKKERLFEVERMFFSGEPDWMWIAPPQPLKAQVERFVPLLDDEEALFSGDY